MASTRGLARFRRWVAENPKTARDVGAAVALKLLDAALDAAPVGEPAAMPPEMPEIQVGDMVAVSGYDMQTTAYQVDTPKEAADWMTDDYKGDVLAIYRDPLWRRTDRKGQTA